MILTSLEKRDTVIAALKCLKVLFEDFEKVLFKFLRGEQSKL